MAKKKVTHVRKPATYNLPKGKALVLRTCDTNMRSYNGFQWPESGPVKCQDWSPEKECGNGLHGLLWGEGRGDLLSFGNDSKWLVVEIDPSTAIDLVGKIKFPGGVVVFVGDRNSAPKFLGEHGGAGRAIVSGTATAGDNGTATAGYSGTATAGVRGTATAGYSGTAKSGDNGIIVCRWWEEATALNLKSRWRLTVGYVGEDGIKPNTFYRCDELGKLTEVK